MKLISTLVVGLLLVGCLPAETVQDSPVSPLAAAESVSVLPTPTPDDVRVLEATQETEEVVVSADDRVIQEVVRRLAERLDVPESEIEVLRVFTDEFPAQNLGCPSEKKEPGLTEPVQPAFVTGKEILLEAQNQQYSYRVHGGEIVFCGR